MTVLTAALLGVAVGAGIIAGCANNDEPEQQAQQKPDKDQDPAPDPEPTDEETPDGPEIPEHLDRPYVHVVLDYFDAWHAAMETGDTDSFMKYATDNCVSCTGMEERIEKTHANGGEISLSKLEPILTSKRTMAEARAKSANVMIHYREGEFKLTPSADADPQTGPAQETVQQVSLTREGNRWLITEIYPEKVK